MQVDTTQDIPREARPTGDGRFLYRFRGRDYILTREQLLHQGKRGRHALHMIAALGAVAVLVVFLVVDLGGPWRAVPTAGLLVLGLVCLLGFHWRTRTLLDGCDTREVPKTKGAVARVVQWLEYNCSIYLGNNPRPIELFFYFLASVGTFVLFMSGLWSPLAKLDGPGIVIEAVVYLPILVLSLGFSAVSLYAFCRAIAGNRGKASGPDRPPSS